MVKVNYMGFSYHLVTPQIRRLSPLYQHKSLQHAYVLTHTLPVKLPRGSPIPYCSRSSTLNFGVFMFSAPEKKIHLIDMSINHPYCRPCTALGLLAPGVTCPPASAWLVPEPHRTRRGWALIPLYDVPDSTTVPTVPTQIFAACLCPHSHAPYKTSQGAPIPYCSRPCTALGLLAPGVTHLLHISCS